MNRTPILLAASAAVFAVLFVAPLAGAAHAVEQGGVLAASVDTLRRASGIAISVVETRDPNAVYELRSIEGHPVIYPRGSAWDVVVTTGPISKVGRWHALVVCEDEFRRTVPELSTLLPRVRAGSGNRTDSPWDRPVSVRARGTAIEKLVDVLGDDPAMYFTAAPEGDRFRVDFDWLK